MRYFMHDPSTMLFVVEDIRKFDLSDPEVEEISEGLYKQLKAEGWDEEEFLRDEPAQKLYIAGDDMFAAFIRDVNAWDMFVTGPAGTGKTHMVATDIIPRCRAAEIDVIVVAFTHKACDILRAKLPDDVVVMTLHKFLNKRPLINVDAKQAEHVTTSKVCGKGGCTQLLIIDEYGMVGEKDLLDLRALQDPNYDATPLFKTLWLGDSNQLTPVGDVQAVKPKGDYCMKLTEIKRTNELPLLGILAKLVNYIEGKEEPAPIAGNECFIRGVDIVTEPADIILAYTNARVQELNALKQGYDKPLPGDTVFCGNTHRQYEFVRDVSRPSSIMRPYAGNLELDSKYKTLEYLLEHGEYSYAMLRDIEDDTINVYAYIFGFSTYNVRARELKEAAAASNVAITQATGAQATAWAKANPTAKLARARAKAWRDFLTFDECVLCLDFDHARTVHKAQGSTFDVVAIDTEDLYKCALRDPKMYLRLLYVAVSRAAKKVITN